uniref:Uncharacterized protein n=1 Tax=Vitis vinifera TaxID=29760 RepID=F6HYA0_VITVI
MAQLSQLTQYIESYVDSSRSSTQQAASVDAIAYLLKNDILTLETLVTEMGMYLTTTDNIIRTRETKKNVLIEEKIQEKEKIQKKEKKPREG